jgi:hypothetical protein
LEADINNYIMSGVVFDPSSRPIVGAVSALCYHLVEEYSPEYHFLVRGPLDKKSRKIGFLAFIPSIQHALKVAVGSKTTTPLVVPGLKFTIIS